MQQYMIERLLAHPRRHDENPQVLYNFLLSVKIVECQRTQSFLELTFGIRNFLLSYVESIIFHRLLRSPYFDDKLNNLFCDYEKPIGVF